MRKLLISVIGLMGLLAANAMAMASERNPEGARDTILQVVSDFQTKVVAHHDVLVNDPLRLHAVMQDILAPFIDFDDFAKKVMGKYYRRASDEQVKSFVAVTQDALIKAYGAAVVEFDPSKLTVLPLGHQRPGSEVRVDAEFELGDGSPVNIAFYMQPRKENGWRLSNVVINNINFGLTFRKQFGVMMNQNGNNMDQAILAWQDSLAAEES